MTAATEGLEGGSFLREGRLLVDIADHSCRNTREDGTIRERFGDNGPGTHYHIITEDCATNYFGIHCKPDVVAKPGDSCSRGPDGDPPVNGKAGSRDETSVNQTTEMENPQSASNSGSIPQLCIQADPNQVIHDIISDEQTMPEDRHAQTINNPLAKAVDRDGNKAGMGMSLAEQRTNESQ